MGRDPVPAASGSFLAAAVSVSSLAASAAADGVSVNWTVLVIIITSDSMEA